MLALIQRVTRASVVVQDQTVGAIDLGIWGLLGIAKDDDVARAEALVKKVLNYRIFSDAQNKMNLNVGQVGGGVLVVSQFTLAADTRKGLRPSFSSAADPATAEQDRKSTRLNSSHVAISYAVFCLI